MVQVPEGTEVSTKGSTLSPIFIKKVMLTKDAPLSSHLANYVL